MPAPYNPAYLALLSERQHAFAMTARGIKFLREFVWVKGRHLFIIGDTGSGKTQKGYWILDWLCRGNHKAKGQNRRVETQVWISTGKSGEILPLLCMGMPVRVIIPARSDFSITEWIGGKKVPIKDLEIVEVGSPQEAWQAVKRDHINIFEFRNTITRDKVHIWMAGLFETLAVWTREGKMPKILPLTIYGDETQWFAGGTRVTNDRERVHSTEIVIENALEGRSGGIRLVLFGQSYKNIPPAARENMTCILMCRGAQSARNDSAKIAAHTQWGKQRDPSRYKPNEGKFIHDDNSSSPFEPWIFPLYPRDETDQKWIKRLSVNYGKKFGENTEEAEAEIECLPELGRYAALAVQHEEEKNIRPYDIQGGISDELSG